MVRAFHAVTKYPNVKCCYRMLCARVINGVGTGCLNAIVPVWSAEVATHTSRGAFIASEFTLNILGVVVAYWLEFGMGFVGDGDTTVRWRVSGILRFTSGLFQTLFQVPDSLPNTPNTRIHGMSSIDAWSVLNPIAMRKH